MGNADRRAKVTSENHGEATRLRELWNSKLPKPSQAQFGFDFGIGNQSAVGQFLRGETPLSLKAARGFAKGLGCRIEDFSPRLAALSAEIAEMVPSGGLSASVAHVATELDDLPPPIRDNLVSLFGKMIHAERAALSVNDETPSAPPDENPLRTGS